MTHTELTNQGKLTAEAVIKAMEAKGVSARIDKTYLDAGQNWTWDTILVDSPTGGYQALNPRQQEAMNNGTFDYAEINDMVAFAVKCQ